MEDRVLLILDVDETLLHAADAPLDHEADFVLGSFHVYLRPGLGEFIDYAMDHFAVAVWSSATEVYVHQLVGRAFPQPEHLPSHAKSDRPSSRRRQAGPCVDRQHSADDVAHD